MVDLNNPVATEQTTKGGRVRKSLKNYCKRISKSIIVRFFKKKYLLVLVVVLMINRNKKNVCYKMQSL